MRGVTFVERLNAQQRVSFVPTDPFFPRQWHPPGRPWLRSVAFRPAWLLPVASRSSTRGSIATIPSSGEARRREHVRRRVRPEGQARAWDVRRRPDRGAARQRGHRLAFPARLLIAKVVRDDGVVPLEAGSGDPLGGRPRGASDQPQPRRPPRPVRPESTATRLLSSAVEYAVGRARSWSQPSATATRRGSSPGSTRAPRGAAPRPRRRALARDGSVPMFSNRDDSYNDIAAPGDDLFSTLPYSLTALRLPVSSRATPSADRQSSAGVRGRRSPPRSSPPARRSSAATGPTWARARSGRSWSARRPTKLPRRVAAAAPPNATR